MNRGVSSIGRVGNGLTLLLRPGVNRVHKPPIWAAGAVHTTVTALCIRPNPAPPACLSLRAMGATQKATTTAAHAAGVPNHPTAGHTAPHAPGDDAIAAFIGKWQGVQASELSTAQSFVNDLCDLLGQPHPHPTPEQAYMFERPITFLHGDGSSSAGRVDCYKRGHFVLEAKKLKAASHTKGFDDGLLRARSQAEAYARALPAAEGRPPFVLVVDVGTVIEVYAEFSRSGGTYTPFPDARSHRLTLADLHRPEVRERLHAIWAAPDSLDPARRSAQVTRDVAALLAKLANSLERRHPPEQVAAFLTRCLFSMFAEDVGLLPAMGDGIGPFVGLLKNHCQRPEILQKMLSILWADMDRGGFCAALTEDVLRFNGKLFKGHGTDGYSLRLEPAETDLLIQAAKANWREVEPAIFGTLLERALHPAERHALGAHYTPRAYVERLVLPTVIQPLRAEWANAQAAALVLAQQAAELEAQVPAMPTLPANAANLGQAETAALTAANRRAMQARTKHLAEAEALRKQALGHIKAFHHRLCTLRVLDPACGSANFLYVTLEHLKRLEGEVLTQAEDLGGAQGKLALEAESVTVKQLLGIELNPRAAALAELVLWIGWLQWHIRTRGNAAVAEPVVHDYGNIQCRDAVLAWERQELALDAHGKALSRWDGTTFKPHPVTGEPVPDEAAQVPQWRYVGAQAAEWPQAEFIVGNPPFIGASAMRAALGDGYVQALRAAWPSVPESADLVMFWWSKAAALVGAGQCERMGLITTNSLRQTFNRRVVQAALDGSLAGTGGGASAGGSGLIPAARPKSAQPAPAVATPGSGAEGGHAVGSEINSPVSPVSPAVAGLRPVHLAFAVPDHPWVDGANGAAVRIAMTVMAPGASEGRMLSVTAEQPGEHGEVAVALSERSGLVHADLSVGANVAAAHTLQAMGGVSSPGVKLHGAGFIVTPEEAAALAAPTLIKPYRNGRDLTDKPRGVSVIDAFGLTADELRTQHPAVYQWLLERVKPERDQNNRATYRDNWWIFGEPRRELRPALAGLPRYIATVETAKHRTFQFLHASILPDNMLIAIGLPEAFHLGVLSSELHGQWALATGGTLEDRPRYNKTRCFETFPFPDEFTGLTPTLRERIANLAQQIDDHRKRVLATPGAPRDLTLTNLYNVREALRAARPLTDKEKAIHTTGLVGVLHQLHTELDAAVLAAYGWADLAPGLAATPGTPAHTAATAELLQRLVALNARRAAEEAQGTVRWLRPDFQNPTQNASKIGQKQEQTTTEIHAEDAHEADEISAQNHSATPLPVATQPWPATLPEQVHAVAQALAASPVPLTLEALAARFKGKGPWKKALPTLLQTLHVLGRAQPVQGGEGELWRT